MPKKTSAYRNERAPIDQAMRDADGDQWLALRLAVIYQAEKDAAEPKTHQAYRSTSAGKRRKRRDELKLKGEARTFLHQLRTAAKGWAETGPGRPGGRVRATARHFTH